MSHAKSICPRQSARLSQKRHDRRMADCLVPDSQPEQNEPLVVIPPTTSGFSGVPGQKSQQPLESQSTETETNKNSVPVAQKNNTIGSDPIHHHINNVNDNSVHTSSLLTNNTDNNPHTAHSDYRQQSIGGQRQHYN